MNCVTSGVVYYFFSLEKKLEEEGYLLSKRPEIFNRNGVMVVNLSMQAARGLLRIRERQEKAQQLLVDETKDFFGGNITYWLQEKEIGDNYCLSLELVL